MVWGVCKKKKYIHEKGNEKKTQKTKVKLISSQ